MKLDLPIGWGVLNGGSKPFMGVQNPSKKEC